ncbi:MAG: efflux RND transporter periplasmic adaptor subunit [Acidobacteria bacterium]|nr:efflux RND transporter periplasmic adaptor subunit [Acidobacteriota bacterium]
MRKIVIFVLVVAVAVGAAVYFGLFSREQAAAAAGRGAPGGAPGRQGAPGGGGGGFGGPGGGMAQFRPPMSVEVGKVSREKISSTMTVVGNLIGQATVEVVPRTAGRLVSINVRLGDPVTQGQMLAKIEDNEIIEQVRQAEAAQNVALATIRQREADLALAQTNVERSRNLFGRQLLPRQTLDDAEARYQAAMAQLDLARAQLAQNDARLQELKINLANTRVTSPVTGFVSKRAVDPGAWVSQQVPIASVVAIATLRLVSNIVERDLTAVNVGDPAIVEVDAYPGEKFSGRIARVSPVLDPATRTAEMEVEVPNRDNRLKPGMYARVALTVDERADALVVPRPAVVDFEGKRGVWTPSDDNKARFVPVELGMEAPERVEVIKGLKEGDQVVVVGAASLRTNDTLMIPGRERGAAMGGDPASPRPDPAGRKPQGEGGRPQGRGPS